MKIELTRTRVLEVQGFPVPNYLVGKEAHVGQDTNIQLDELTADQLSDLCFQWRRAVFKKAGLDEPQPPKEAI